MVLFYHEKEKIARKSKKKIEKSKKIYEKQTEKRLIFFNVSYIIISLTKTNAAVVKLADAMDSKSIGLILRVGSTPTSGTKEK